MRQDSFQIDTGDPDYSRETRLARRLENRQHLLRTLLVFLQYLALLLVFLYRHDRVAPDRVVSVIPPLAIDRLVGRLTRRAHGQRRLF